jgi:hypothetical protein
MNDVMSGCGTHTIDNAPKRPSLPIAISYFHDAG